MGADTIVSASAVDWDLVQRFRGRLEERLWLDRLLLFGSRARGTHRPRSDYDFVGSCIAKSIKLNGHFMFHFDEDLLVDGPSRGFTAVRWAEL